MEYPIKYYDVLSPWCNRTGWLGVNHQLTYFWLASCSFHCLSFLLLKNCSLKIEQTGKHFSFFKYFSLHIKIGLADPYPPSTPLLPPPPPRLPPPHTHINIPHCTPISSFQSAVMSNSEAADISFRCSFLRPYPEHCQRCVHGYVRVVWWRGDLQLSTWLQPQQLGHWSTHLWQQWYLGRRRHRPLLCNRWEGK